MQMSETYVLIARLVLAGVLGGLIGAEREYRAKVAGMRTHMLVAIGAALMLVVSRYGFGGEGDPSRVAAQIVSGIGFIGAGAIMVQRHSVHGLTTAAGVWVSAGIGMAVASGLYAIAIAATVLSLVGLEALGWFFPDRRQAPEGQGGRRRPRPRRAASKARRRICYNIRYGNDNNKEADMVSGGLIFFGIIVVDEDLG